MFVELILWVCLQILQVNLFYNENEHQQRSGMQDKILNMSRNETFFWQHFHWTHILIENIK